jgi:hypothetical protein
MQTITLTLAWQIGYAWTTMVLPAVASPQRDSSTVPQTIPLCGVSGIGYNDRFVAIIFKACFKTITGLFFSGSHSRGLRSR